MAIPVKKSEEEAQPQTISTTKKEKNTTMATEQKETKTIIRTISTSPDHNSVFSEAEVSAYISQYLQDGWKVLNTHYLGNPPEGWIFAWILVR